MSSFSEVADLLNDPWPQYRERKASPISSAQFQGFHGTNRDLTEVTPAVRHGRGSHWNTTGMHDQQSKDHAFATTSEDVAWRFAHSASQVDPKGGRARVYTVAGDPEHEIRPGVFNREHPAADEWTDDLKEYVSQKYRVTGRHDIMPGHQGTFPQEDWNRYRNPSLSSFYDMNHPDHDEAEAVHADLKETRRWQAEREAGRDPWAYRPPTPAPKASHEVPGQMPLFNDRRHR